MGLHHAWQPIVQKPQLKSQVIVTAVSEHLVAMQPFTLREFWNITELNFFFVKDQVVHNVHPLIHLVEDVRINGALDNWFSNIKPTEANLKNLYVPLVRN